MAAETFRNMSDLMEEVGFVYMSGSHGFVLDNLRVKVAMTIMLENTIKLELVNIIQHCY